MLYSDRLGDTPERQFKITSKLHEFLQQDDLSLSSLQAQGFDFKEYLIDHNDQTWRPGNLVCVVRANDSVDENSIHVVAAAMQRPRISSIISEMSFEISGEILVGILLMRVDRSGDLIASSSVTVSDTSLSDSSLSVPAPFVLGLKNGMIKRSPLNSVELYALSSNVNFSLLL
jgi:hypothetical protein